ncbi:MAG: hypothetical protein MSH11_00935 [Ruminococcus sp.]|nr:hypothetical protein [Ruminococcus sp.]
MTYSWFDRSGSAEANSMGFNRTMSLNEKMNYIDAKTSYSSDEGLTYTELSRNSSSGSLGTINTTLQPGKKIHFKTIVYNIASKSNLSPKDAKVTVKLENSTFPDNIRIGTVSPLNSETGVSAGTQTVTVIENVSVPADSDDKNGTTIEWYISLSSQATELSNITLGNLCIYQV